LPWWWHPARDAVLLACSLYMVLQRQSQARNSDSLG
jgi:hypothetical protein